MSNNVLNLPTQEDFNTRVNQLRNAIASFGGFALLPSGTVSVSGGVFSVPYTGSTTITAASIEIPDCPRGISQSGLTYTVAYANGTATFTLNGYDADGVYTSALDCLIKIGDTAYAASISGLPVVYQPTFFAQAMDIIDTLGHSYDASQNIELDLTDLYGHNLVYPQGVSPAAELNGNYWEMACDTEGLGLVCGYIENNTITIPAGTLPTSADNWCHFIISNNGSGAIQNAAGAVIEVVTQ